MFLVLDSESGEHDFSLKPMNCPSHHLLYGMRKHSYRELPVRYATFDVLHRNEVTGALSGLTRVRQFQQDDCHIYLPSRPDRRRGAGLTRMILDVYATFGLTATLKFATRPEQRIGEDAMWDRAEADLRAALEATGHAYELKAGDGAFYGPKIDFDVSDSIGRKWQLGTIQLDYAAPERFDLGYVGEDNAEHRPVVIHRAMCGSFERFIAILIEHFAGAFPVWLSPEQVRVLPISDEQAAAARHGRGAPAGGRGPGDARRRQLHPELPDSRGGGRQGPLHGGGRAAGGRGGHRRDSGARRRQQAGGGAGGGVRGAGGRADTKQGAGGVALLSLRGHAVAEAISCLPEIASSAPGGEPPRDDRSHLAEGPSGEYL